MHAIRYIQVDHTTYRYLQTILSRVSQRLRVTAICAETKCDQNAEFTFLGRAFVVVVVVVKRARARGRCPERVAIVCAEGVSVVFVVLLRLRPS